MANGGNLLEDVGTIIAPNISSRLQKLNDRRQERGALDQLLKLNAPSPTDRQDLSVGTNAPGSVMADLIKPPERFQQETQDYRAQVLPLAKRLAPEKFAESMLASILPKPPLTGKDRYSAPSEGGVFDYEQMRMVPNTAVTPKPPSEITTALWAANGDPEKARASLNSKGMKGDWAIDAKTGKMGYVPESTLLGAPPGTYLPRPNGMKITSDGQGGFSFSTGDGAGGSAELTTPNKTSLQEILIKNTDSIARLENIKSGFKPEYQELGTRWKNLYASSKEKMGIPIDPTTKAGLEAFTTYRRDTAANTNQIIKDITGATVGETEAQRLMLQMPVAGQGPFDGDSPTEFEAKLNGTIKDLKAANARAAYALKNNLTKSQQFAIPLSSVPQMIEAKGAEYEAQVKRENPGVGQGQIQKMVEARLRQEFGL